MGWFTVVQLQRDEEKDLQHVGGVKGQRRPLEAQLPQFHRRYDRKSDVTGEEIVVLRVREA